MNCPECGVNHKNFPRKCYYSVHADHAHVVIARVVSNGNSDQQAWAREAQTKWDNMKAYVSKWPEETKQ